MKRFEKYTHHQVKSLIGHLKNYGQSPEPDALHQIRVSIKKVKAILGAIHYDKKKFKAHKNFIPFREIFRQADSIREPEVLAGLLRQFKMEGIEDEALVKNDAEKEDFVSAIPDYVRMVKTKSPKLESLSRKVSHDAFRRYLKKEKKWVKSQLSPKPQMRTIHKVRKRIKTIVYLSRVRGKLKTKDKIFYNKLEEVIGQFHDKQVLLGLLKHNADDGQNSQREKIRSVSLVDKKAIHSLVKNYY